MNSLFRKIITIGSFLLPILSTAQSWTPPADSERCPCKWGVNDERGSANHMKPETVLRAARLVKKGQVIELGHILTAGMPFSGTPGTRSFNVLTKRTFVNPQSNKRGSNEEYITGEMGQIGTQFDGFAHQTIGNSLYNCFNLDSIATRTGFRKLGIEKVGTLITRGVLIDIAGLKSVEVLPANYEITVNDIQQALAKQELEILPGDAVIIHTGHGKLWDTDKVGFTKAQAGIGVEAALWLAKKDPMLVGSDNSAVEINPNPDAKVSLPVHQIMLVVNGIHLLENMKLDELVKSGVREFQLIVQPLKIQGGTGSTVAPVAVF